jgi:hypothetical protein
MATLFETLQLFDNNGVPLSGGHFYTYEAGTTNPAVTWQDEKEVTTNLTPMITLDSNGRFPGGALFIRGSYKFIYGPSDESWMQTIDYVNEYNQFDFTGLTATISDLNSTHTLAKIISGVPPLVYTVLITDRGYTLLVNALTANATINLPNASTVGSTCKIWIKKTDNSTNTVTIIPFGGQTIDNSPNKTLYDYNDFIEVRSDGSNWKLGGSLIRGTIVTTSLSTTLVLANNGNTYNIDATSGTKTFTLPDATVVGRGFTVSFKKIDSSVNGIIIQASQTIDGLGSITISTQWSFVQLKTDGNNWFITTQTNFINTWVTGDRKEAYNKVQSGWVWMDDGTIGDASSNATSRHNADTLALFTLLWSNANLQLYNSSGGAIAKGASASADFSAHNALALPKSLGRSSISTGSCGQANNYTLAQTFGEELHSLSTNENGAHVHYAVLRPLASTEINEDGPANNQHFDGAGVTGSSGSGAGHNTVHPVTAVYYLIKL